MDLKRHPWEAAGQASDHIADEALGDRNRCTNRLVGSTLPVRTTLLATGRFLSMVPRVVMQFPPKSRLLRSLPIELPDTTRPLALVTLKNRTLNPLAELFGNSVREAATRLQKSYR